MPQLLPVASIGYDVPRVPNQKSSIATLSTGHTVVLTADPNMPSAGGGAGTGAHLIYVTLFAPGQVSGSPTQVGNFSFSSVASTATTGMTGVLSICVDSANNVHVAYVNYASTTSQSIQYRKLTWTGTTFTIGGLNTVMSAVANRIYQTLDIDIPSNSTTNPMVTFVRRDGTTSFTCTAEARLSTASGTTWVTQTVRTVTGLYNYPDIAVSFATDSGMTDVQYILAFNPGPPGTGAVDLGDYVYAGRITQGTGFVASSSVVIYSGINKGLNGGFRNYSVYYLSANNFVIHCQARSAPSREWIAVVSKSSTDNTFSESVVSRYVDTATATYARFTRRTTATNLIKLSATNWVLQVFNVSASAVWVATHEINNVISWTLKSTTQFKPWNGTISVKSNFLIAWAGDRGRFITSFNNPFAVTVHTRNNAQTIVQRAYAWTRPLAPTMVVQTPQANQLIASSTPETVIGVTGNGADASKVRLRVQQQLSNTPDFSAGVVDRIQLESEEVYYGPQLSSVKISQANYPINQGIWYIRARSVDQYGLVGNWTPTTTFRVSHPPRAISMAPADNAVVVYKASGCLFTWRFSDAYSLDKQTAYQVDVYDAAGALLVSTGKVATNSSGAYVVIPAGSLETYVTYYVTLWDLDDQSAPPARGGTVLLTQVPVPVITYPMNGSAVLTNGTPTITWNPGLSGTKTQKSYRLQLRRLSDGKLLYDTQTIFSTATSHLLPSGLLRNAVQYAVYVSVVDSTNLQGVETRTFTCDWIDPLNMQAPYVNQDNYLARGFVDVEVDAMTGKDADNITVSLYRRVMEGNSEWVLVDSRPDPSENFVVRDWTCPANILVEYIVTQTVDRFGETIESSLLASMRTQVSLKNASYWLIDLDDPSGSLRIPTVTSDSYTPEVEEAVYVIADRGRVVEIGEEPGVTGTLSCQFRDQDFGWKFRDQYNLVPNPNLEYGAGGVIDSWTVYDGGSTGSNYSFSELNIASGPGQRSKQLAMTVQKTSTSSFNIEAGLRCVIPAGPYLPSAIQTPGHLLSAWMRTVSGYTPDYRFFLRIEYRDGTTVLGTETQTFNLFGKANILSDPNVLESVTLRDDLPLVGSDLWGRFGLGHTSTSYATAFTNVRVTVGVQSIGSTALSPFTFAMEGIQYQRSYGNNTASERRADATRFFTGDTPGASWLDAPNINPAYNPGALTARWVKQKLEKTKASDHRLLLRTPFGDSWPVHLSNLGISRVAGVGSNEMVDVEIPYLEVGE